MGADEPTTWSVDNYDGEETWREIGKTPNSEYKNDGRVDTSQSHRMVHALYNWENTIDDLIRQWSTTTNHEWKFGECKIIREGVRGVCVDMHREVENVEIQEVNAEDEKALLWNHQLQAYTIKGWTQKINNQLPSDNDEKMLACVTRSERCKKKRVILESDGEESDEENEQLVCSMTGQKWEALPSSFVPGVVTVFASVSCSCLMINSTCLGSAS